MNSKYKPGEGRRKKFAFDKGRQLDAISLEEVKDILPMYDIRRDHLIEYLHILQDKFKFLYSRHLRALADVMKLSMAEVYEVASFYAHFTILDDKDDKLPDTTIRVCESLTCSLFGGEKLYKDLEKKYEGRVRVLKAPCMGKCDFAPALEVEHNHVDNATLDKVENVIKKKLFKPVLSDFINLETYINNGGYELYKKVKSGEVSYEDFSKVILESNLRGLGGAGFPASKKWEFVKANKGPRMMCINGDEGEVGTFKDKYYLDRDPHRFIEGTLIAAYMVEAEKCFIYMRDEYPGIIKILRKEVDKLIEREIIKKDFIEVRRGAGAYICGEESALIESVEGKRGIPRHRPPYVAQNGVFGLPTLVHNVETVYWLREIYEKGSKWFLSFGRNNRTGLRSFSVSGFVKNPGVKLAPAGISVSDLINEYCGGMLDGHKFIAYLPGGASGGILPAKLSNIPLDFDTLQDYGCFIGSAAIVIISDKVKMKDVALNLMKFFEDESCGQCTPCRNGTTMAVKLMNKKEWNVKLLKEVGNVMTDASICGLGQAAANPLTCILKYFPEQINSI
ncbi:MAG: NADH-quinone oxidoreductase subunit F [Pelagibacterales bacterium]|nr:NADH-quinone oxidoreductase subunit F [Pelagibacterales bacterium]PPR15083.1 MAG: NADH-quinone oxidoreductase subunit 1 [Alphaproteobacteria bacterium MarineAlpha9_Bin3]|tara:strand:- start:3796 stop:5484 length:1689 start_codon:yes stop_codon:yes gene_type:complete